MTDDLKPERVLPKPEARSGRKWLRPRGEAVLALLLCVAVDVALTRSQTSLRFPDAMEYAQIARSVASGNGYRIRTLWLSRLSVPRADAAEWAERGAPDVRRPPLHVMLTALAFRMFGASDAVAVGTSAALGTLAAWMLFLLVRKALASGMAWLSLALFLFDPGRIFYNATGLTESLFTLLLLIFGFLLMRASTARDYVYLGIIFGLLAWTRHNAFLLVPPVLLAVAVLRRPVPWRKLGLLVLVFLPFFLLPAVRNRVLIGSWDPVGMPRWVAVNDTGGYPEHLAERSLERPPSLARVTRQQPTAVIAKAKGNLPRNARAAETAPSPFLWLLVIFGVIWWKRIGDFRIVLLFCVLSEILLVAAFSLGEFEGPRFFVPFTPLWLAVAAAGIREFLRLPGPKGESKGMVTVLVVAALCLLAIYPGVKLAWPRLFAARPAGHEALDRAFQREELAGKPLLSDVPWAVGWYGDRTAYWLPFRPGEVAEVLERTDVAGIFLTPSLFHYGELDPQWQAIYGGERLEGFERAATDPSMRGLVLLIRQAPQPVE